MPRNQADSTDLRQQAIDDLVGCDIALASIGGLVGDAVDAHASSWFALADDLLSDGSSPSTWVRDGVAAWIQCFETQATMYRGICSTICPPSDPQEGPVGIVQNGVIEFTIDVDAENSDPIPTAIPPSVIGSVNKGTSPLARYLRLSLSPDGTAVYVGLVGLGDGGPFRPGVRKVLRAVLTWGANGSQKLVATRLPRQPSTGG